MMRMSHNDGSEDLLTIIVSLLLNYGSQQEEEAESA
jgi:hypothetical protein